MSFTVKPLSKTLGAEVTGIDLSKPIDDETKRALNDAWIRHAVLVIRDQNLTPPQFAEAARIFAAILEQQVKSSRCRTTPKWDDLEQDLPIVDGKLHVRGENFLPIIRTFRPRPRRRCCTRWRFRNSAAIRNSSTSAPHSMSCRTPPCATGELRSPHVYEAARARARWRN